jgi:hypothetical protein
MRLLVIFPGIPNVGTVPIADNAVQLDLDRIVLFLTQVIVGP